MGLQYADRAQETCSAPGTGTVTLLGAVAGWQSLATAFASATTTFVYYTMSDGTNWEVGIGTYTTSGTTLSRQTVLASSNSGALVNFTGTTNVWVDMPASVIADRALTAAFAMHIVI